MKLIPRQYLQHWLLAIWIASFACTVAMGIAFFLVFNTSVKDFEETFKIFSRDPQCENKFDNIMNPNNKNNIENKTIISIDELGIDGQLYCNRKRNSKAARIIGASILAVYLPTIAIMLASFFSPAESYRKQNISRSQALIAAISFAIIQLLIVSYAFVVLIIERELEDLKIEVAEAALVSSILGLIVTFSFPEKLEAKPAVDRQSIESSDGRGHVVAGEERAPGDHGA